MADSVNGENGAHVQQRAARALKLGHVTVTTPLRIMAVIRALEKARKILHVTISRAQVSRVTLNRST